METERPIDPHEEAFITGGIPREKVEVTQRSIDAVSSFIDTDALIIGLELPTWTSRKYAIVREVLTALARSHNAASR
jgi:hypothetical protein